jgi:hypothetical protein
MQKKIFLLFKIVFLIFISFNVNAQNNFSIKLIIKDSASWQPLSNALVNIPKTNTVAEADRNGQILLNLQQNNYKIIANYPGSKPKYLQINLQKDTAITVYLSSATKHYFISEVEVTGRHFNKSENVYSGLERVKPITINRLPALFGEKDIIKTLNTLPGVTSGSEGSADINVRGGTTDQNLFLIDGNTIYRPSHLFGFFSTIVPEIVEEVNFYKGNFPVNYGGKLSSVIDIKTKDPLQDTFNVKAEISTLSLKVTTEAPLIKNKTSILLSARATHFDKFMKLFDINPVAGFYEVFGKISHKINNYNKLTADVYFDNDYYKQNNSSSETFSNDELTWKNQFANATYTHNFKTNGTFLATAGWTRYKMLIHEKSEKQDSTLNYTKNFNSYVNDKYLKFIFRKETGKQLNLILGADYIFHNVLPASVHNTYYDTIYTNTLIASSNYNDIGIYGANTFSPLNGLKIQTGIRFNYIKNTSTHWYSFDPRINIQYLFKNDNSIKLSYTKVSQTIHLLRNAGLGMPIDIHIPFSDDYKPEYANQYSVATNIKKKINDKIYYLTIEGYYKQMENIISYLPGASSRNFTTITSIPKDIDEIITQGKGKSYGLEFLLEKPYGKFNGSIAYTLSKTTHQFDDLNNGKEFFAQHHRPHNLAIVASYKFNKKHSVSANFNFTSGARMTLPTYIYNSYYFAIAGNNTFTEPIENTLFYSQSELNAYKMRDYHVLNISYLYKFEKKKWNGEFEFSIYNIYNRKNPYYYYLDYKYDFVDNDENTTGFDAITQPSLIYVSFF